MIPYGKHNINKSDILSVTRVLKNKFITQGKTIGKFENAIKKHVGAKYAVAVSSCSAGLHLAAQAFKLGKGKTLLTSPNTFCSTANAASHCRAEVDFVDIENKTGNLSIAELKKKLSKKKIHAVTAVHFGGLACEMNEIKKLSKKYNFVIFEDAAHALGSCYKDGSRVGSCKYSDLTVFSFHPVKSITTGEGGVITTNNFAIYKKLKILRSHGIEKKEKKKLNIKPWYYEMKELGHHYRITDIQCALGLSQLKRLSEFIKRRKVIAKKYDKAFTKLKNCFPLQYNLREKNSNHLYVLRINFKKIKKTRMAIISEFKKKGIGTQVHYIPVINHPYYQSKKYNKKKFKNTFKYYEEALSIPIFYDLTHSDQNYIIRTVQKIIG
jgi:perosamine synthetase